MRDSDIQTSNKKELITDQEIFAHENSFNKTIKVHFKLVKLLGAS